MDCLAINAASNYGKISSVLFANDNYERGDIALGGIASNNSSEQGSVSSDPIYKQLQLSPAPTTPSQAY